MQIAIFSNFINHHQIPVCNELFRLLNGGLRFVATVPLPGEQAALGYKDASQAFPYVINACESEAAYREALRAGRESDVVIIGSAPEIFITERLRERRLTFRYYERFFKQGAWRLLNPRVLRSNLLQHTRYRSNTKLHMLCAGAYTAADAALIGAYPGRCWKWGYFTEVKNHKPEILFAGKGHDAVKLLWAGRFIDWKHPEKAVGVMERLMRDGCNCTLDFIGRGDLEDQLKSMVKEKGLNRQVNFIGAIPPEQVRKQMEGADIFLFTSDKREGWGAVLNESMNSGCAVVASDVIGSVPFLVRNGENGFVYRNNSFSDLYSKVEFLVKDRVLRDKIAQCAMQTMETLWNPAIAAQRLIVLSQYLLSNSDASILFTDGPCSIAE